MRSPFGITATGLSLVTQVTAFYPYVPSWWKQDHDDHGNAPRHEMVSGASNSMTLPLLRTPSKRTNNYQIDAAETPTQPNSVGIDQDGSDFTYMVKMKFGTSDEDYHMLMDTAASNTWVMSSDCTSDVCNAHNTLGKGDSSSLQVSGLSSLCTMEPPVLWLGKMALRGLSQYFTDKDPRWAVKHSV
jgi:hypothetical protein